MNYSRISLTLLVSATLTSGSAVSAAPAWWSARGAGAEAVSPAGNLRAQSIDDGVVRLWFKTRGEFERRLSKAIAGGPRQATSWKAVGRGDSLALTSPAMQVQVDRQSLGFTVMSRDGKRAILRNARLSFHEGGAWTLDYALSPDEHLLGLGQDNRNGGKLERRGTIRDLWSGQQINSGNVTASYPIPLLISTGANGHAYGLFVDNVHHMRFDLGAAKKNEVSAAVDGGEADLYVIDGPTVKQVVERYTKLTGRPSLPPLWALGYWQSKCVFWQWSDLDDAARQLTARGFPYDVMVIDYDWPKFLNNYQWSDRWSAGDRTPAQRIQDYAKQGVRIVMSNSGPMVVKESPTFASGWAAGVFATDGKGNPVQAGYYNGNLLDFTSSSMDGWLYPQVKPLIQSGVAAWWLDLTEPEGDAPQTVYQGGGSADIHNQYSLLETEWFENAQIKANPGVRPWILTRTGSAGIQRHHASLWTGDIHSDFATLAAHPGEMLSSGLSGITWWTSDSGGFLSGFYKNDQYGAHARLYERWMQLSVFSPITRAHHSGPVMPYEFGVTAEQGCLHYLQLRYKMLPYIYSYAWEASQTGVPIARALALEYPNDAKSLATSGDEYLFGREMLVAPVLHDGVTRRSVYFPPGRWIDWEDGYEYDGGRTWVVAAPQNRIPVAVRAGAIIPMAPLMRNTSEKSWDPITLDVFPSGTSSFTMYKDDGKSFGYEKGESTRTKFTSVAAPSSVALGIEESNKKFTPKQYVVRLHLNNTPRSVTVDGAAAKSAGKAENVGPNQWAWDASARVLTVGVASGAACGHGVVAHLDRIVLPRRVAPTLKAEPVVSDSDTTLKPSLPNFYPPMRLPNRVKAANYDKGGPGNAYQIAHATTAPSPYRIDNAGLQETDDAGGGFALAGLSKGDWLRYTVDGADGGYFDATARVKAAAPGELFHLLTNDTDTVASFRAAGQETDWRDITVRNVYLNPGEQVLLLSSLGGGFALNTIEFRRAENPPATYLAALAAFTGPISRGIAQDGGREVQTAQDLGKDGTGLDLGVYCPKAGPVSVTLRYGLWAKTPVALIIGAGNGDAPVSLEPTGEWNSWKDAVVDVPMKAGMNRLKIKAGGNAPEGARLQSVRIGS